MKIGIISDIHSNPIGLLKILRKLQSTDIILCAGDIVGYNKNINEVFDILRCCGVLSIKGNHDCYVLGELDCTEVESELCKVEYTKNNIKKYNLKFLKGLPNKLRLNLNGKSIAVYHGSPWNLMEEYIYPNYKYFDKFVEVKEDIIVLGHTHYPFVKNIGKKLIINPGSCGHPRGEKSEMLYSAAMLNTKTMSVEIIHDGV